MSGLIIRLLTYIFKANWDKDPIAVELYDHRNASIFDFDNDGEIINLVCFDEDDESINSVRFCEFYTDPFHICAN